MFIDKTEVTALKDVITTEYNYEQVKTLRVDEIIRFRSLNSNFSFISVMRRNVGDSIFEVQGVTKELEKQLFKLMAIWK